jgi:twitching motility protein PilU
MAEHQASDLYFSVGAPVGIKVEGVTKPLGDQALAVGSVKELAYALMNPEQIKRFEKDWEMDMAFTDPDIGRFRVNVFKQRGEVAMVVRYIRDRILSIEELNLPPGLKDLVMEPRGLVLVVGTTGSGKSTTLASMLDYRNQMKTGHILTIEDPVEYLHHHKKSIVNQREVGFDTHSYESALKRAMREAPDVIMIGEIRDRETMEQALMYAETGHLCLSTVHATNANQTLERIVTFFPDYAREALLSDISYNLRAIVAQRLLIGVDGRRVPAVEVLLNTLYVQELIQKGEIEGLKDAMEQGVEVGMSTFDQSLYQLYRDSKISLDIALQHADSPNNLSLKVRLETGGGHAEDTEDPFDVSED